MIFVGTSGFQYDDWVGPYYPADLEKKDWLSFYSKEFNTLEINYTYYRPPTARTLASMAQRVPAGFSFTIKATQEMTHGRNRDKSAFAEFHNALAPLQEQSKFGAVLAQFPSSFHAQDESRNYLEWFREQLPGLPIVVEFRNKDWLTPATFEFLKGQEFGFCGVDEPFFPRVAQVTSPIAYVRFHGRNAAKWWTHDQAYERYDYTYTPEELKEWTPKIEAMDKQAARTYVFANNHYRAQGIDTARQLKLLLEDK